MPKLIPLTKGMQAIVDSKDYPSLARFKWYAHRNWHTKSFYAVRHETAVRSKRTKSGWLNLSRTMQQQLLGKRKGLEIDHRNRNTLDNRRRNLRWATRAQQAQNRMRNNACGYKGLFRNDCGQFTARITVSGKRLILGTFPTPERAARAYNTAALQHFGEFARLNPV